MSELSWHTVVGSADPNPFVGPRPIHQGEALYGRDSEVRELFNVLQARRIVVLHSSSGAGKTSLVQAGLIPRLREGNYDVWKPIRVNLDPTQLAVAEPCNRYLLSAMVSLEQELPVEHRRSPIELARSDFLEYLETRPRRKRLLGRPVVLLFDQFEEVLTVQPLAVAAKHEFFEAVGRALEHSCWALFIMREDNLAALAPYRARIPTQLSNTVRIDLLDVEHAREVAVQLAAHGGRSFPAVDQLIRELSAVRVQQPDGDVTIEYGQQIEPVHLQVVCRRLWEAMPEDSRSIEAEDLDTYADIAESLGRYYSDVVSKISGGNPTFERMLRKWVGDKLIVGGHRAQVRHADANARIDGAWIEQLLSSYLVRALRRAEVTWLELSHDRLIEPIQLDNLAWEQRQLTHGH